MDVDEEKEAKEEDEEGSRGRGERGNRRRLGVQSFNTNVSQRNAVSHVVSAGNTSFKLAASTSVV